MTQRPGPGWGHVERLRGLLGVSGGGGTCRREEDDAGLPHWPLWYVVRSAPLPMPAPPPRAPGLVSVSEEASREMGPALLSGPLRGLTVGEGHVVWSQGCRAGGLDGVSSRRAERFQG